MSKGLSPCHAGPRHASPGHASPRRNYLSYFTENLPNLGRQSPRPSRKPAVSNISTTSLRLRRLGRNSTSMVTLHVGNRCGKAFSVGNAELRRYLMVKYSSATDRRISAQRRGAIQPRASGRSQVAPVFQASRECACIRATLGVMLARPVKINRETSHGLLSRVRSTSHERLQDDEASWDRVGRWRDSTIWPHVCISRSDLPEMRVGSRLHQVAWSRTFDLRRS